MIMLLILDSGAFSAWAKNGKVVLQDYIDFIHKHKHLLTTYVNLDDITSPDKSWENQREMERQGLSPLPVYHVGEPDKYLKMAMEYDYFGVGGMALKTSLSRESQFDIVFTKVCTKENDYFPSHKLHGFGLTAPHLIIKFPWFSCDSTSWVMYGKYGLVLMPKSVNGVPRYDVSPHTVAISARAKSIGDATHFNNLPDMQKERIIEYCESLGLKLGKSVIRKEDSSYKLQENEKWIDKSKQEIELVIEKGICNNHELRDRMNLIYFLNLDKNQKPWPWAWTANKREALF